jgi:hypothetical protein
VAVAVLVGAPVPVGVEVTTGAACASAHGK